MRANFENLNRAGINGVLSSHVLEPYYCISQTINSITSFSTRNKLSDTLFQLSTSRIFTIGAHKEAVEGIIADNA